MNDTPFDRLPSFNRVSIRAVLVNAGEDPGAALAEAGITDAVAIPVVLGDDLNLPGALLGNGITPNLTGVLEAEDQDDFDPLPHSQNSLSAARQDAPPPAEPVTTMLPTAFGLQPLAPVRRSAATSQRLDADSVSSDNRATGS